LLLLFILSACSGKTFTNAGATKGPIQLYDVHGVFLCEIHGTNQQTNCFNEKAAIRQVAQQFLNYTVNELAAALHVQPENLPSSALKVSTTLDLALQKQTLQAMSKYIATMATTHNMHNAAEVTLDYHNGAIRSFLGTLDNEVNILTRTKRLAGVVFKPFEYATAFEQGISPGEVVYDAPFSVGSPPFSPLNDDMQFHGYLSYRSALQNAYNIPSLKLYIKTGFPALRENVIALGIKPEDIGTSGSYFVPIGGVKLPLLDTTVAYGTMANGGMHIPPHAIDTISTPDHRILYTAKPQQTPALSPPVAFMMTDVMSDNTARTPEYGACSPLLLYTTTQAQCEAGNTGTIRPAAVHGGVGGTFKDTFTIGYTSDLVVGAWAGNNNNDPMMNITGLDGAAQIWHDTMLLAEAQKPITPFPGPPAGVVKKTVSYPHLTTTDWYHTL
jgi:membrane peptidoglycan carboxypeptidase